MRLSSKERRQDPRCAMEETVELRIYGGDSLSSQVKNISWAGLLLSEVNKIDKFGMMEARQLKNRPIAVTFDGLDLTARGSIIRVNPKDKTIAIRVSSTSNDNLWRERCMA